MNIDNLTEDQFDLLTDRIVNLFYEYLAVIDDSKYERVKALLADDNYSMTVKIRDFDESCDYCELESENNLFCAEFHFMKDSLSGQPTDDVQAANIVFPADLLENEQVESSVNWFPAED